ncbi:MAG: metal-sensitive transcriptional regulator [Parcubacteria group bacterium]|nr:metal-sensitive transcriptional regulator [Parcubacteria group bacterium]
MEQNYKKKLLRRLAIIRGQLKGLERLIVKDTYCVDVITQSLAVKEALSRIEDLLLEHHLATHVVAQMKTGKSAQATKEIIKLYTLSKRK